MVFAKEKLRDEKERYERVDNKINRLLNVITIFIGISGFMIQLLFQNIIPPVSILDWVIMVSITLFFFSLLYAWVIIIYADRLFDISSPPLNEEMFSFFKKNNPVDICYHLSINYQDALKENREKTDIKISHLKQTHSILKLHLHYSF